MQTCRFWGLLLLALIPRPTWGAWEYEQSKTPALENLPARLKAFGAHSVSLPKLRIAYLGVCPKPSASVLDASEHFSLFHRTPANESCPEDTHLVRWLRQAWPNLTVITADLPKESSEQTSVEFAEMLDWVLSHRPQVLVIRESFLNQMERRNDREATLAACWKHACLPIVLTQEYDITTRVFPGVLHTHLVDDDVLRNVERVELSAPLYTTSPLGLPIPLLRDIPGLDIERAGLAYIGLLSAALPAAGQMAHLERASQLLQLGSVWSIPGSEKRDKVAFQSFDVSAILANHAKPSVSVQVFQRSVERDTKTGEILGYYTCPHNDDFQRPGSKILIKIHQDAPWKYVEVGSRLTQLRPVSLYGTKYSHIAAFQLDPQLDDGQSMEDVTEFWSSHVSEQMNDSSLFKSIQWDEPIKAD